MTALVRTSLAIRNSIDLLQPNLALDGFEPAEPHETDNELGPVGMCRDQEPRCSYGEEAPKFTEGKQNRLSQVKQRHQLETDSLGGKPVLRGL
jgi:hypothetical protein